MKEERAARAGTPVPEAPVRRPRVSSRAAGRKNLALVKPVLNCVNILRHLSQAEHPATLTQITRKLGINPSTCLSILRTLVSLGLVAPHANTKAYVIGDGVISLAEGVLGRGGLLEIFRHPMEQLARKFSVTVTLWRMVDEDRMYLATSAVSDANVRIQMRLGQRLPRWVGAVGRVMAAHSGLSEAELRRRFAQLRWQSPPTFRTYMDQVADARHRGYAEDDGNFDRGVLSIAVPVFDLAGDVTMACGVTMFSGQHTPAALKEIVEHLTAIGGLLHPKTIVRRRTATR